MARGVAFSGKQKKAQLREKHERQRQRALALEEAEKGMMIPHSELTSAGTAHGKPTKPTSVERLQTVFAPEPRDEVERRRASALQPLNRTEAGIPNYNPLDNQIAMPSRPPWSFDESRDELENREQGYFKKYLEDIYATYPVERLNYFEHNLEVWRQLWRVIEISDILLLVTDVRYPLFHFPASLYHRVVNELHMPMIMVLNKVCNWHLMRLIAQKVDLVPVELVEAWESFFKERFPQLVTVRFSCYPVASTPDGKKRKQKASGVRAIVEAIRDTKHVRCSTVDWESALQRASEIDILGIPDDILEPSGKPTLQVPSDAVSMLKSKHMAAPLTPNATEGESAKDTDHKFGDRRKQGEKVSKRPVLKFVSHTGDQGSEENDESDPRSAQRGKRKPHAGIRFYEEVDVKQRRKPTTFKSHSQPATIKSLTAGKPRPLQTKPKHSKPPTEPVPMDGSSENTVDEDALSSTSTMDDENTYNDGSFEQSSNADTYEMVSESDYVSQSGAGAEADDDAGSQSDASDDVMEHISSQPIDQQVTKLSDILTVAMVGHPNVGKSALLNALMGRHVVSVKSTPGHTKHLQTHFLAPHLRLCDCPGLVFPALDMPKPLQVLCGIFPIARYRDPVSAVQYLAERVPLETMFNLKPVVDDEHSLTNFTWTAFAICESFAVKRGMYTARIARPDVYRAANFLLRAAYNGKILGAFPPPNMDADVAARLTGQVFMSQSRDVRQQTTRELSKTQQTILD